MSGGTCQGERVSPRDPCPCITRLSPRYEYCYTRVGAGLGDSHILSDTSQDTSEEDPRKSRVLLVSPNMAIDFLLPDHGAPEVSLDAFAHGS